MVILKVGLHLQEQKLQNIYWFIHRCRDNRSAISFKTQFGTQYQNIDVKLMKKCLRKYILTGGKYFRATDNKKLKDIYEEIDLPKNKIQVTNYKPRTFRDMGNYCYCNTDT